MTLNRRTYLSALLGTALPGLHAQAQASAQTSTACVTDETWTDVARQREVPVKVRWPDAAVHGGPRPVVVFSHGLGGTRESTPCGARHGPRQALWCSTCSTRAAIWTPFAA